MTSSVHDHYVRCSCEALYSDNIAKCPACKKDNPELKTDSATSPSSTVKGK